MSTEAEWKEVDPDFGRYLIGELLWELKQHPDVGAGLRGIPPDDVAVIAARSYQDLRVRAGAEVYDVWLSWQLLVPPRITPRPPD